LSRYLTLNDAVKNLFALA